ncbi:hypothetical protein PSTG_10912 [Puccinia striiformis f. sp. tritici PST-78]|uniref:Retrotransposon gag domain-containing protein n=1 Tax=Puccinia striiformis f. sp. tritici PST-78 TaxID=1165861 RepID=A0A0L0V986_9BASI|nr:hypothetical protein PSTG_10912 [Puccinia striiformis f. sp. tritici PST-78]
MGNSSDSSDAGRLCESPRYAPLRAATLVNRRREVKKLMKAPDTPASKIAQSPVPFISQSGSVHSSFAIVLASAEKRCLAKILANATEPDIHVPSTSPSTLFHTPATSSPSTPVELPFTPSLLCTKPMADPINPTKTSSGRPNPSKDAEPPKGTDPPKRGNSSGSKGGGSASPNVTGRNPTANHYVELLLKLQHTAAVQLQEERQNNIDQRCADHERIARLENTLFDVVTKAEEEIQICLSPAPKSDRLNLQKFRIADGPSFRGTLHDIEPFLKWITQLQIFFSTKGVTNDDNKICVASGLLENTMPLDFYVAKGPTFVGKPWNKFKTRLFKDALPQRWRTTLKTKLRQLTTGPKETFIAFSGQAQTLQILINFDDTSLSSSTPSPPPTRLSDFDLAEFVVLKRVAVFDENTVQQPPPRASRGTLSHHSPSNSPPNPAAWRVHAYLDSQGQCHHCKTTCRSTPGTCTKPLNKKWVKIPDTFQTPCRPTDYKPPKAHGASTSTAGKPTHPPAGRPPFRAASLAAVTESETNHQHGPGPGYTDVVEAIEVDHQVFVDAVAGNSL